MRLVDQKKKMSLTFNAHRTKMTFWTKYTESIYVSKVNTYDQSLNKVTKEKTCSVSFYKKKVRPTVIGKD